MTSRVRYKTFEQVSFADLLVYSKLPKHPFWSNIVKKIDFSFADQLCSVLYSGRGQNPYAPSLKLKIHLIQTYYNLSDRQTEEKIMGDLFIKRFLDLPVDFFGFDHSTIGLDRTRMGAAMFRACHFYVLAQMNSLGLWGDKDEQWIIDSFPSNVAFIKVGAYRLIQQGMVRITQHLKRSCSDIHKLTILSVSHDALLVRLPRESSRTDQMLAFSKLVAQAYALLQWFQLEDVKTLFQDKSNQQTQQKSKELQANLRRILEENSKIHLPSDGDSSDPDDHHDAASPESIAYEKIPYKERPGDRIVTVTDPQARVAKKNRSTVIKGYKQQNLCTTSGVILNVQVIPATEHDRDAMFGMAKEIQTFFGVNPRAILGDTAYGHGEQRVALSTIGISVVAPVITTQNSTGKYDISLFSYDRERDLYTCPNNNTTVKKTSYSSKLEGWQYKFDKKDCSNCPLQMACTTANNRSIFHSGYYDLYQEAKAYNASVEGLSDHGLRYRVEPKNNELKNHCGLGRARTRSKTTLTIKANLAAIVVNCKHAMRKIFAPKPGFLRRACIT